jgi:cobyrinic acid a,c-diamide synthase
MGQSAAAILHGFQHLDPQINLAGVIVNKVASADHEATIRLAITEWTGIPILGVLRRDTSLTLPSRHLGLVPVAETSVEVQELGAILQRSVDLDGIMRLASTVGVLPPLSSDTSKDETTAPLSSSNAQRVRLGLALDNAFSFYYPETLETFTRLGFEVVPFSPLTDRNLPNDLDLLYFGGGFPEVFAAQLADNRPMLASVHSAAQRGILIYAECGGYMYLGKQCIDANHTSHNLVGVLPYTFQMGTKRAQLGYREITLLRDTIIGRAGTRLRGHEFHWSHIVEPLLEEQAPYQIEESSNAREGYATETVLASYIHIPLAANPQVMGELIQRCYTKRFK